MEGSQIEKITGFIDLSKKEMKISRISFGLSLLYNIVGLSYAISGQLSPIIAAIIMPLSSITVVVFVTLMSNVFAQRLISKKDKVSLSPKQLVMKKMLILGMLLVSSLGMSQVISLRIKNLKNYY